MMMMLTQLEVIYKYFQGYLVELHHKRDSVHDDEEEDEVLKRRRSDEAPHLKPKTFECFVIISSYVNFLIFWLFNHLIR